MTLHPVPPLSRFIKVMVCATAGCTKRNVINCVGVSSAGFGKLEQGYSLSNGGLYKEKCYKLC